MTHGPRVAKCTQRHSTETIAAYYTTFGSTEPTGLVFEEFPSPTLYGEALASARVVAEHGHTSAVIGLYECGCTWVAVANGPAIAEALHARAQGRA